MLKEDYEKKPCHVFTMEVLFRHVDIQGNTMSTDRWYIHNQSWQETRINRETLFQTGLCLGLGNGKYKIIFPVDLIEITMEFQKSGWKEQL